LFSDTGAAILNAIHSAEQQHLKARLLFTDKAAQSPMLRWEIELSFSGYLNHSFLFLIAQNLSKAWQQELAYTLLDLALVPDTRAATLRAWPSTEQQHS